jgi:hypothetical protein
MMGRAPKTQVQRLNNIQLQSSSYGLPLALYYGTNRGTGNLIWYGNFKAIPHSQKASGGKGLFAPSSKTTDYTYTAAVLMALGEGGLVAGIGSVWKGKDLTTLSALGLTLFTGASGQAPWSFLSGYNVSGNWAHEVAYGYAEQNPVFTNQALGYDTTSYLAASAYDLGSDATIPNHGFEIISSIVSIAGSGKDCDPRDFITDFLTHVEHGVGLPSSALGDLTTFSTYCLAAGILLSPSIVEPRSASSHLEDVLLACNTDPLWSDGLLKLIPRGDTAVTGNGQTYTPNLTPIYDLVDDDFLPGDIGPVHVTRTTPADAFNEIRIEFSNRANQYNAEVANQPDQNAVEQFGLRQAPVKAMHFIAEASVAKIVAQTLVQRSVYIRNTYEFGLTDRFALLEPGDFVTLTDVDATMQMTRILVRILQIEETEDGYQVKAEELPVGVATAPLYPHDSGLRYLQDLNAAPLSVSAPHIFELPADPSATGLSLGIATGKQATDLRYGGCNVWASSDGTNYQLVGRINGSSRYGTLTALAGSGATTMLVAMTSGGQLPSVTADEAAQGATLIAVGEEYVDYTTATLTGPDAYTLTGVVRELYDTLPASHASGTKFTRVDDAICRIENMDLTLIGQTLHFKMTAFNTYGGAEQALADATAYTYTVTGYMEAIGQKAALAKIGEDSWLSPVEKNKVILDYSFATNEKPTIDDQADAVLVSRTTYDTAYSALTTYLGTLSPAWNDPTTSTPITRATWDTKWGDFEDARRALIIAIRAVDARGTVTLYLRQYATPATPTGDSPSGWSTGVPAGTETVWQVSGTVSGSGSLIGVWSAPVVNIQGAARSYNGSTTWYLGNIALYNGGTYEALQDNFSGQAPSGTGTATAYWGVRAAPGATGSPGTPPSGFAPGTINLASGAAVNLRAVADANGYTGAQDATITFAVPSGVTIRGLSGGGIGIDTGTWPTGTYSINLTLVVQSGGIVDGGGGAGGDSGFGTGGDGGDAIFCQVAMSGGVTINSGGTVRAGGGGGGGGSGHLDTPPGQFSSPDDPFDGGGGGGGGAPNGAGGAGELGSNGGSDGSDGSAGTTGGGGAGGSGFHSGATGGTFATAGGTGTGRGAGGGAGFAVRKNGHTVTVTNSGTMTGSAA